MPLIDAILGPKVARDLLFYGMLALIIGAIVHIGTILVLPRDADHDAYARVSKLAHAELLKTIEAAPDTLFPYGDPAFAHAFCLFDVTGGPVRASVDVTGADFVSLSLHGRHGRAFYALTSSSASRGALAVTLMTAAQLASAESSDTGDEPMRELRVEVPEAKGFVAIGALAVAPSAMPAAQAAVRALKCEAAKPG